MIAGALDMMSQQVCEYMEHASAEMQLSKLSAWLHVDVKTIWRGRRKRRDMHVPEAKRWDVTYMNMRRIISVLRCDHAVVFCKRNANNWQYEAERSGSIEISS